MHVVIDETEKSKIYISRQDIFLFKNDEFVINSWLISYLLKVGFASS